MKVHKDNNSIYTCEDIVLTNYCDGTINPFEFSGLPKDDVWVKIDTLRMMKKVIDAALKDAKKVENVEYVNEYEERI